MIGNIKIINQGATSASFTSPFIFVKYVIKYKEYDVYQREKYLGSILQNFDWYPKLLYSDDINQFFIFLFNFFLRPANRNSLLQ